MLDLNVRVDKKDIWKKTAFLMYYSKGTSFKELAFRLLPLGADINAIDENGMYALKYALKSRQNEQITELVNLGADVNLTDIKGRNLLHHAVNMSSATSDVTFDTE